MQRLKTFGTSKLTFIFDNEESIEIEAENHKI